MQEIWKDIKDYEELYQISNYGNIRSKDRKKRNNNGSMILKGKMLHPLPNSNGYLRIQLVSNMGKRERFFVHRLVALHFVPNDNPNINTVVNHIDSNYLNNRADNLEWTTMKGNSQHALKSGRMNRTVEWLQHLRESCEKNGKSIIGTNIKTGEKIYFTCLNDCKNKGFQPSCVCYCCKGKQKAHKGYIWNYCDEKPNESVGGENV